jgi:hypothetical protein
MQLTKFFKDNTKVTPENLGEAIQQAIESPTPLPDSAEA